MIANKTIAYKIGFSDSLSLKAVSAYNDMAKWRFSERRRKRLHEAYCSGWMEGYRAMRAAAKELLSRHTNTN